MPEASAEAPPELLPTEVEGLPGRYRPLSRLGRGAFAVAYRCQDTETGGEVVVKLYELRDRAWSLLTSFEREAAVLAELSHPAIPRYLEHGQLPDGRLMLVQSCAPGRSLGELLREGKRFTDAEVADLAEQVLGVLEYLQSLNPPIVHRDIKPGNLVLDASGRVRLVDFGSVKEGFRRDSELGSTIVGTYGYMAPEQFQGRATIQSDLYALGATLVHVLSHVPPADLPQEGLKLDFRASVKASPGMLAWLERMLEPDPRQRFANAQQALAAFRARDVVAKDTPAGNAPRPALVRLTPPSGSRITCQDVDGELRIALPAGGFRGPGLVLFAFASIWLLFITFWTAGALRAPLIFALFSIPFWLVGFWMMSQALTLLFGTSRLSIGPERYTFEKRLFGRAQHHQGLTRDLEGLRLNARGTSINGQHIDYLVLRTGAADVSLGGNLSQAEQRWLVERVNAHLGVTADEEDNDDGE